MKNRILICVLILLSLLFVSCTYEPQVHEHLYGDYSFDEMYHWKKCLCGHIDKSEHNFEYVCIKATCEEEGLESTICIECGYVLKHHTIPALGHELKNLEKLEPTCTKPGHNEGTYCLYCDYSIGLDEIPALGHSYESELTLPTCLSKGYISHTCHCGDTYIDSYVDELGHDIIVDEGTDATCTETGLTEGEHCSRCDYKVVQEVIPAKGHKESNVVVENNVLPTCVTKGSYDNVIYCSECNEELERVTIIVDELGHDIIIDERVEATCTTTGLTKGEHCSRCDYKVAQEVIPAKGHKESAAVVENNVLPTCVTKGSYDNVIYCSECSEELDRESIEVNELGHNYEISVILPTCEENGYNIYTCSCGYTYNSDYVEATGHVNAGFSKCENCNLDYYTKGLEFSLNSSNDSYYVSNYKGVDPDVVLPMTYKNKPVTSIGDYAFLNKKVIESINMGKNVTSIGQLAFCGCINLRNVYLPYSIENIGLGAFGRCQNLVSITLPENLKGISNQLFAFCENLKNVEMNNRIEYIDHMAFYGCTSLERIIIPSTVTEIYSSSIPENTRIEYVSTKEQWELLEIDLPFYENHDIIFYGDGLEFELLDNLESYSVVGYNDEYDEVAIPSFYNGLPVTTISEYAFYDCVKLNKIVIPATIKRVEHDSINFNDGLGLIVIEGDHIDAEWGSIRFSSAQIILKESIETLRALLENEGIEFYDYIKCITDFGKENEKEHCITLEYVLPTCINNGYRRYQCSECNQDFLYIEIPAYGHSYNKQIISPTCKKQGYTLYSCYCGDSYIDNYVEALGHNIVIDAAVDATCTETGLTEGSHCDICGEIIIEQEIIEPFGHQVLVYNQEIINYTVTNDTRYPFKVKENEIISTNKSNNSSSTYTITAKSEFTLELEYKVSSESGCDYLIINHNSIQKVKTSGTSIITYKKISISLVRGDIVTITYSKDSSYKEGNDCCYVKILTENSIIVDSTEPRLIKATEQVINSLKSCTEDIICAVCNDIILQAAGDDHDYVYHEPKQATCTEKGYSEYYSCARDFCNYQTEHQEFDIIDHNFINDICSLCQVHITSKDLQYSLSADGNSYIVEGVGTCSESTIVLNMYRNKPITKINDQAFLKYTKLISITIPDTITEIGIDAFGGCSNITNVYINDLVAWCNISFGYESESEDGVTDYWCTSNPLSFAERFYVDNVLVSKLVIPVGVEKISAFAFYNAKITSLEFSNTVKEIGNCAFKSCPINGALVFPYNLAKIGHYAFTYCSSITRVSIPETLKEIGDNAFEDCTGLTGVYINDLAAWCNIYFNYDRDYDEGLWLGCHSNPLEYAHNLYLNGSRIVNLVIPNSVTSLSSFAFKGGNFTSVQFSNQMTKIPDGAFAECSNISSITLPNTITSIGYYAFSYCSSLTYLRIPSSVNTVYDYAIVGSSNIKVYCSASKKPNGWYDDWNILLYPVYWGC